jgi:hypothetical protein
MVEIEVNPSSDINYILLYYHSHFNI